MSAPVERARPAEQRVHDDLGHRVAGRDEAVHPAAGRRALADRADVRVGGAALLVDEDAAALGDVQPGVAGQLVARADAGGEHDDLASMPGRRSSAEAGDPPLVAR